MVKRKTDADYVQRDERDGLQDPAWQIITRAIWCRGPRQRLALAALKARGLWLTPEQRKQAGLEG